MLLHLPQPHFCPEKLSPKVDHFKVFQLWQDQQNHKILESLTEFSLSPGKKNQKTTLPFVMGLRT